MDNLLAFLKSALVFRAIGVIFLMAASVLGCSLEVDDHTHDVLEHEHFFANNGSSDAAIVGIDPPVKENVPAGNVRQAKTNLGLLSHVGWPPITITFSAKPQNVRVELVGFGTDFNVMSQWTLEDRVLTIRVFCDQAIDDEVYPIRVNWHTGFIVLRACLKSRW